MTNRKAYIIKSEMGKSIHPGNSSLVLRRQKGKSIFSKGSDTQANHCKSVY